MCRAYLHPARLRYVQQPVQEFLQALLQMPTLFFSAMLGVSLLYWVLIIIGAADLNPFDGAEGALKGGVEGAMKGAVHGLGAAGAVEGAAKGAIEGAAESGAAAVKGVSAFSEALAFLGLTKVPVTISFSLFSLFAWFLSYATRHALDFLPSWLAGLAATGVAVVGGIAITSVMTKPLSAFFKETYRPGGKGLVGRTVRITTEKVDSERGQGEVDDGAGGITVSIRCSSGVLTRGDEAVILEADAVTGLYWVEPSKVFLPDVAPSEAAAAQFTAEASAAQKATVEETVSVPNGSPDPKRG